MCITQKKYSGTKQGLDMSYIYVNLRLQEDIIFIDSFGYQIPKERIYFIVHKPKNHETEKGNYMKERTNKTRGELHTGLATINYMICQQHVFWHNIHEKKLFRSLENLINVRITSKKGISLTFKYQLRPCYPWNVVTIYLYKKTFIHQTKY
ncbi:hypothetical protein ACJX0J_029860 [Zea mays]